MWRRLLAELDATELTLYLDIFTDGSRDVFVAVTSERLLSWTVLTDRFRRMVHRSVQVTEHTRTVQGVLRLSTAAPQPRCAWSGGPSSAKPYSRRSGCRQTPGRSALWSST
ncbi:hypothetical protein [Nocardioides sp. LML1-1-1.1]|uniref:hypothetical protein n=1 Tax=Nocardioides sp. LML1-1-1.1 TaxID=3135248 RepID=UPI00341C0E1F